MTEKDFELLSTLTKATEGGRVEWTPTATDNEFTSSFKGKFNVTIRKTDPGSFRFEMVDSLGRQLLLVYIDNHQSNWQEVEKVSGLFEMAQRQALAVDAAIDEIIGEIGGD